MSKIHVHFLVQWLALERIETTAYEMIEQKSRSNYACIVKNSILNFCLGIKFWVQTQLINGLTWSVPLLLFLYYEIYDVFVCD